MSVNTIYKENQGMSYSIVLSNLHFKWRNE